MKKDLVGQKFGRLKVLKYVGKSYWLCRCDCGNEKIVRTNHLTSGNIRSCGCLQKEEWLKIITKHGFTHSRLYKIWENMKSRCYRETTINYECYGGRGIKVCKEWLDNFINFYDWAINNGYSDNLTIDRIDVNGNYEPQNCRWTDNKTQSRNTRRNHYLTYNGETHCISEWTEILGFNRSMISDRLKRGWNIEKALTTPNKRAFI